MMTGADADSQPSVMPVHASSASRGADKYALDSSLAIARAAHRETVVYATLS